MASASGGGGIGLAGGIAATVVAVGVGALYLTGNLAPAMREQDQVAIAPDPVAPPTPQAQPAPQPDADVPDPASETSATTEEAPDPQSEAQSAPAPDATPPPVEPGPVPDTDRAVVDLEPEAEVMTAAPEPEAAAEPDAPAEIAAPTFDVVRVAPDGATVVAGTGPLGSQITLFLDGLELARTEVDGSGKFVSFLTLPPSDAVRILTLMAQLNGQSVASVDEIILAPPPPVAAAADPDAVDGPVVAGTQTPGVQEDTAPAGVDIVAQATAPAAAVSTRPTQEELSDTSAPEAPDETDTASGETTATAATTSPAPAGVAAIPTAPTPEAAPVESAAAAPSVEAAPMTVLKSGPDGVEVLQSATAPPPDVMDKIALDTISYSELGEVQLSGRSQGQSAIRVYLNNKVIADLTADADGRWRGLLNGITPGVYTLRLDELGGEGQVLSRIETPFKREAPEVLVAAPRDTAPRSAPIRAVTVQTGDTLWAMSRERYGDGVLYVRVFEANRDNIRDPDLIYPGQVFEIPE